MEITIERSFRKMDTSNICQIKYIIRFLLLWIIFQVTAATEDTCSFEVLPQTVISNNISEEFRTRIEHISSAKVCGQKCCDRSNCTAALFKESVCLLVNCDSMPGGCKFQAVNVSIFTINVSRTAIIVNDADSTKSPDNIDTSTDQSLPNVDATNEPKSTTVLLHEKTNEDSDDISSSLISSTTLNSQTLRTKSSTTPVSTQQDTSTSKASVSPPVSSHTTPLGQVALSISAGGNQEIRLPDDSVSIHADVTPKQMDDLDYRWKLIEQSEDFDGTQSGSETSTLKLAALKQGVYQFKVEVHGDNSYGEAFVNITVLPKIRVNKPPVAVIVPPPQVLTLPTDSTLLDGSKSYDDDGITLYEWEEVEGPLQDNINKDENGNFPNEKVLKITGLVVGNYTFKLTVTDTDGVTNSTTTTIVVKKKVDSPPIANAGPNQVIHMPQNSITLCGNDSTDDWGITEYKWSLDSGSKKGGIDMRGSREKCVKVSNLEAGDYTFQLTVTDEAGQEDTAKVTIIVQPESNHPPTAKAGEDQQLILPLEGGTVNAELDGTGSSDDKEITSVLWAMVSGPAESGTIVKPNALQTSITGITKPGEYTATLTVSDADGDSDSDTVKIFVKEEQPPVANAGPDITISLPDNVAMLNGSKSTDDYGIVEYYWTRTEKSPAAGFALQSSERSAILQVAELVQGTYTFKLKVTNVRGKSSEDEAKVTVLPDPLTSNLAELQLDAGISRFNEEHKMTVVKQLEVLLSLQAEDKIVVRNVFTEHGTGHLIILFYVLLRDEQMMSASDVTYLLNSKLKHDVDFLEFKFIRAETFVCENDCSGHGRCRSGSHECECDMFWMENFFRVYMGDGKRNCDWSVLYAGIVIFILITAVSCMVWFLTCFCLNLRQHKKPTTRKRKKHKTHDKARYEKLPMKPPRNGHARKNGMRTAPGYKSSSIMRSVSSSTSTLSDSDAAKENTIFERKRLLVNGGGKFNGAFDLDANPNKLPLRKNSSFAKSMNSASGLDTETAFGHQSTILTVGNSSGEEIL